MESCFPNYFIYFSSSRMQISLPAVTSTGMLRTVPTTEQQRKEQQTFRHTVVVAVVGILCQTLLEKQGTPSHTTLINYQ